MLSIAGLQSPLSIFGKNIIGYNSDIGFIGRLIGG